MNNSNRPIIKHVTDFIDYCEVEKGLSENTQRNYSHYLKAFIGWLKLDGQENKLPHQLLPEDMWSFRLYLARRYEKKDGKPLTKKTQNYYLIAVRALLDYFTDRDIASLPSGKIKLAKEAKTQTIKFLTLEQLERLLEAPKVKTQTGLRDRAILESLFSTGLRVSELAALNRDQIHFKDPHGLELTIKGKGSVMRTVYFSTRALLWIKKYLETRHMDVERALFINNREQKDSGRRLSVRSIQKILTKYSKISGIPILASPHTLRHSYATDLLIQGVDLRTVQEFLGHKNVATTQIYTHVTNKRLKDIHEKFHGGNRLKNRD